MRGIVYSSSEKNSWPARKIPKLEEAQGTNFCSLKSLTTSDQGYISIDLSLIVCYWFFGDY